MKFEIGDLIRLKNHYALEGSLGVIVGPLEGFGPMTHRIWVVKWMSALPLAEMCHETNMEKVL